MGGLNLWTTLHDVAYLDVVLVAAPVCACAGCTVGSTRYLCDSLSCLFSQEPWLDAEPEVQRHGATQKVSIRNFS